MRSNTGGQTRAVSLLACFFFMATAAVAQIRLTQPDINEILAVHNKYRRELGIPPLTWSTRLATNAATHANLLARTGSFRHSNTRDGENLAFNSRASLTEMVEQWGSEKRDYQNRTGRVTGHYTQIVWRNTTTVGCGLARNATGSYLVCQYAPAGNIIGEKPY